MLPFLLIPAVLKPGQTTLSFNGPQIMLKKPGRPPILTHTVPSSRLLASDCLISSFFGTLARCPECPCLSLPATLVSSAFQLSFHSLALKVHYRIVSARLGAVRRGSPLDCPIYSATLQHSFIASLILCIYLFYKLLRYNPVKGLFDSWLTPNPCREGGVLL